MSTLGPPRLRLEIGAGRADLSLGTLGPPRPPRPLRLRRFAVLRVMLRPRAAARVLAALAAEAGMNRVAVGVVLRACAEVHYSPGWRR